MPKSWRFQTWLDVEPGGECAGRSPERIAALPRSLDSSSPSKDFFGGSFRVWVLGFGRNSEAVSFAARGARFACAAAFFCTRKATVRNAASDFFWRTCFCLFSQKNLEFLCSTENLAHFAELTRKINNVELCGLPLLLLCFSCIYCGFDRTVVQSFLSFRYSGGPSQQTPKWALSLGRVFQLSTLC